MRNEIPRAWLAPLSLLPLALPAGATSGPGGDDAWPQWRGPAGDGIARETGWSPAGKPESAWSLDVGIGYSSVSVANGRLYTMGHDEEAKLDVIWCLDAETGEEVWALPYEAEIWNQAHRGGTLGTPSIDGDVVFTLNREGHLFCLDAATGEERWHRQIKEELDLEYPTWGFSASPLVLADELVVNAGKVLSFDKETGDLRWSSKDYGHAYCTPVGFELSGKPALAVLNGDGIAVVGRADGGELYFEPSRTQNGISAATPIVIEDAVFVSSNRLGGGALFAFGAEGLEPVWESRVMTTGLSGCVLMEGHLYGFDQAVLKCIDVRGEEKWSQRGIGNGALSGAPGRLILMSSRGELIVAEATPAAYRELSRAKLFDAGVFWTKPVLANGLIYCRSNEGELVCRDHRAG